MLKNIVIVTLCCCSIFLPNSVLAAKYNAYGLKFYTVATEHFDINYHAGLERLIPRVSNQFEKLYNIYRNTYGLTLPKKRKSLFLMATLVMVGHLPIPTPLPSGHTILISTYGEATTGLKM